MKLLLLLLRYMPDCLPDWALELAAKCAAYVGVQIVRASTLAPSHGSSGGGRSPK